jgi:catechol 2,3-dioxygenase-like lactoylglutathione lyase family enzyme
MMFHAPRAGHAHIMIGRLETIVLDTREPRHLARFYAELIGAKVVTEEDRWVTIQDGDGRRLSFQRSPEHEPPTFPDPAGSQQSHVDVRVDDVDTAERQVLDLGATRVLDATEDNTFRVFRDPAGHPFCLVWD